MRIVAPAYHSAEPSAELRRRVLRGASFLLGRQAVTGVLALGAEPMIARTVGPSQYGLWIASLALFTYARGLCSLGIEIYLIRSEASISAQQLDQAFTILAGLGASAALVAAGVLPLAEHWAGIPGLAHVAGALFLLLPLCLTTLVPTATLERTLDYRHIALVESAARILFYAVTLGLLLDGYRVWALVAGYWAQQSIIALFYYAFTGYRPRLSMRAHSAYEMVSYGLGYSSSIWIFQLRNLVNPLIVGRYAGAAAVGYVGLAERLVTMLSFARARRGAFRYR
jgi:PST family polysaccharide transporter